MCVARFQEARSSTDQALSMVAHEADPGHCGNGYYTS